MKFDEGKYVVYVATSNEFFTEGKSYEIVDRTGNMILLIDDLGGSHPWTEHHLSKSFVLESEYGTGDPAPKTDSERIEALEKHMWKQFEYNAKLTHRVSQLESFIASGGHNLQREGELHGESPSAVWFDEFASIDVDSYLTDAKPMTANEQRADIIEKAKAFVNEKGEGFSFTYDEENGFILAIEVPSTAGSHKVRCGISICHPDDVFNLYIGEAIALARALGLQPDEFESAPQPDTVVVGMEVKATKNYPRSLHHQAIKGHIIEIVSCIDSDADVAMLRSTAEPCSPIAVDSVIVDDTFAEYEEVE